LLQTEHKQTKMEDYTIEREFLGSATAAELISRIIRAHLSVFSGQEAKTP